jgi:hypothetical protein
MGAYLPKPLAYSYRTCFAPRPQVPAFFPPSIFVRRLVGLYSTMSSPTPYSPAAARICLTAAASPEDQQQQQDYQKSLLLPPQRKLLPKIWHSFSPLTKFPNFPPTTTSICPRGLGRCWRVSRACASQSAGRGGSGRGEGRGEGDSWACRKGQKAS